MPRRKTKKTRKSATKNHLVFTSSCGKPDQAEYVGSAATVAAAEKIAAAAMKYDGYGNAPKAVFITKIEKTGKSSSDVVWS